MSDLYFANEALFKTINKGSPVQFILGFEYAILLTLAISAAVKYVLHTIEMHRDTFWENKSVFILYLEFFVGKLIIFILFCINLSSSIHLKMICLKLEGKPLFSSLEIHKHL